MRWPLLFFPHRRFTPGPARLSSASFVSMVETADLRDRDDAPCGRWSDPTRQGRVLLECKMRARHRVVPDVGLQHAAKTGRMQNDHMIEALSWNGPDEPFAIGILPR